MLRAEKLCQSVSMSGPSAMANPIAPKIAAISSDVRLIGWISPRDLGRGGRVASIRSVASLPSSAAASRSARRASSAAVSASFSRFTAAPRSRRASGAIFPRSFSSAVTVPLRPSSATRTASQARRSVAAAREASASALRADRSSTAVSRGRPEPFSRFPQNSRRHRTRSQPGPCGRDRYWPPSARR